MTYEIFCFVFLSEEGFSRKDTLYGQKNVTSWIELSNSIITAWVIMFQLAERYLTLSDVASHFLNTLERHIRRSMHY